MITCYLFKSSIPKYNKTYSYTPSKILPIIAMSTESTHHANNYVRGVSFDNMTSKDLPTYSFTLQAHSEGWKLTRRSRLFMVAVDMTTYSDFALDWCIDNLVDDGDEVVVLRVVPLEGGGLSKSSTADLQKHEETARNEANGVMRGIIEKNPYTKLSIIIEFVIGKVEETIQRMITMYQPSMLVVGTRSRSSVRGFFLGSVSRYCLDHSPIPVVVAHPDNRAKKNKNQNITKGLGKLLKGITGSKDEDAASNERRGSVE